MGEAKQQNGDRRDACPTTDAAGKRPVFDCMVPAKNVFESRDFWLAARGACQPPNRIH